MFGDSLVNISEKSKRDTREKTFQRGFININTIRGINLKNQLKWFENEMKMNQNQLSRIGIEFSSLFVLRIADNNLLLSVLLGRF